jgi:hypothetical protein
VLACSPVRVICIGAAVAAFGLLAGCSGSGLEGKAAASAAASSSTVAGTPSAASTTVAAAATMTTGGSAGASGECTLPNLTATLASPRGDGSQRTVSVV